MNKLKTALNRASKFGLYDLDNSDLELVQSYCSTILFERDHGIDSKSDTSCPIDERNDENQCTNYEDRRGI